MAAGRPFFEGRENDYFNQRNVMNMSIAECYNCSEISIWLYDRLTWPDVGADISPSSDLPDDAKADFVEAALILDKSPRGASALLRLAVQKLCKTLGGAGKNIDSDIAELVRGGLDVRVQQALDVVRVVGNNAVHPGQLDLKDDRETAEKLFSLVNLIVEITITQPKHVAEMFEQLPENARLAIEKRDTPKQITASNTKKAT